MFGLWLVLFFTRRRKDVWKLNIANTFLVRRVHWGLGTGSLRGNWCFCKIQRNSDSAWDHRALLPAAGRGGEGMGWALVSPAEPPSRHTVVLVLILQKPFLFNMVFVRWELANSGCLLRWSAELLHGDGAELLLGSYKLRGVNHSCFTSSAENSAVFAEASRNFYFIFYFFNFLFYFLIFYSFLFDFILI